MNWLGNILQVQSEQQDIINRIQQKKELLDSNRPIPAFLLQKIISELNLEWTYNSNSIEGNSITLKETIMILRNGVTVKGKSLREHFEIHNHEKALELLYQLIENKTPVDAQTILLLHQKVLRSIEDEWAGRYRTGGVRIVGANFVPPNPLKVSNMMEELFNFIHQSDLHPLILATLFHHRFVWIHPFFDGNGRTVRLAMNLIIMQNGYPPAIILSNDRQKYYDALNQANNNNFNKLALLILQSTERSLNIYLNALPNSNYDYQTINTIAKEPDIPYVQEYISLLARQGKIDAYKEGRNWLTSKKAVLSYYRSGSKK